MALFTRQIVTKKGQMQKAVTADNPLCCLAPTTNTATGASTITAAMMAGGG